LTRIDRSRLHVTYEIDRPVEREARDVARDIALEQTVELPDGTFDSAVEREIVGRLEQVERGVAGRWSVTISFDPALVADEIPQLLNLLFGNISLKQGIRITACVWPESLLRAFGGPRFGIDGLRALCGVTERRPLLCSALKPVGLSVRELARRCHDLAHGGIDLIKDDHGITDQTRAPFAERVRRCQEAVALANRRTGGNCLYFPNVTGAMDAIDPRAELARESGCRGILLSPLLVGLDTVRAVGRRFDLAVLAHPALAGTFFQPHHGIAPEILLGQIFRIAGSDGVIYPNSGGRFPLTTETCAAIHRQLREPLGPIAPAFPVAAGGITLADAPAWVETLGPDTVFLIGGSLYARGDLVRAAADLLDAVRRAATNRP
jgi:ribulose-bisphosphate carboxylase large chain